MDQIIVRFNFDRWEIIHRFGFHEELLGTRETEAEARKSAAEWKRFFRGEL